MVELQTSTFLATSVNNKSFFGSLSLEEGKVHILSLAESNSLCPLQLHMHCLTCFSPMPPEATMHLPTAPTAYTTLLCLSPTALTSLLWPFPTTYAPSLCPCHRTCCVAIHSVVGGTTPFAHCSHPCHPLHLNHDSD